VIVINFNLFSDEQGVLSLYEEIDRKILRNFLEIVYSLSADLALSAQSSRAKSSLLMLCA